MKLCSHLRTLVLALGVLAVMSAQLFGVGRGFLCDCSDVQTVTLSDHCHGPHGAECHDQVEPAHSAKDCPDDGDVRTHSQIETEFRSVPATAAELVVTPPVPAVLLTLDDARWADGARVRASAGAAEVDGSPPSGVAVARTVVLLI